MYIPLVVLLSVMVIAVQVYICLKTSRLLVRMLPAAALALVQLAFWMVFLLSSSETMAFATVIYSVVLMILLLADLLGWGIYLVVKYVQKKKE